MDHKVIDKYKTITCKDLYSKWHMHSCEMWRKDFVKAAFKEMQEFITTKVAADTPKSCGDLDAELMNILERHRGPGDMAAYQAMFVALLLEAMDAKKNDLYAKKTHTLLTHGYKCQLLAYLLAQLLGEATIGPLLTLYQTPSSRDQVLAFFELS